MKTNYHTHVYRCGHATGDVKDYVEKAIEEEYKEIGISDHAPMPKYLTDRMKMYELEDYIDDIHYCREHYSNQIKIYSGLEIEYFDDLHDYYEKLVDKFDYLILAIHQFKLDHKLINTYKMKTEAEVEQYFKTLIKGIETDYFKFVAHPDLFAYRLNWTPKMETLTHELASVLEEKNIIIEFNANGIRRGNRTIEGEKRIAYPYKPFWDVIKKYDIDILINSDCHDPLFLNDEYDHKAKELAEKWGLQIIHFLFEK
ncbi:histidinol-phosphatase [Haloplasma contractile]|uniref:Histidinol-phosphatase n=1 Tax=Haloplasma contractile SSD-17B TaxID=1033810 RepID=U2EGK9_9MOLU|nr:histidinol-phosphatase [Haloplasma contractile]ERJ13751.1 histidinol-phosphatase PHP family protein [Haloplasma contractile SSD-17B]